MKPASTSREPAGLLRIRSMLFPGFVEACFAAIDPSVVLGREGLTTYRADSLCAVAVLVPPSAPQRHEQNLPCFPDSGLPLHSHLATTQRFMTVLTMPIGTLTAADTSAHSIPDWRSLTISFLILFSIWFFLLTVTHQKRAINEGARLFPSNA